MHYDYSQLLDDYYDPISTYTSESPQANDPQFAVQAIDTNAVIPEFHNSGYVSNYYESMDGSDMYPSSPSPEGPLSCKNRENAAFSGGELWQNYYKSPRRQLYGQNASAYTQMMAHEVHRINAPYEFIDDHGRYHVAQQGTLLVNKIFNIKHDLIHCKPCMDDHPAFFDLSANNPYEEGIAIKEAAKNYPGNPLDMKVRGSAPTNSHGILLHPVSDLADIYRSVFKFGVFNAVQSACFNDVMHTNDNLVISAPTGSGKTVLFELAIIRSISQARDSNQAFKSVYIAPTKALCAEKSKDWRTKFDPLGIRCCELTGDTVSFGNNVWGEAKDASIIITTGEKWDSLTRNWNDHDHILSQVQLLLVDEVHILNEARGSTLEVVMSRMKFRGNAVRLVLVSATIPNIQDIAAWIGSQNNPLKPAKALEFGEEFRPCKLTRHIVGVPRQNYQNDFVFSKHLDYKLFSTLQRFSVGKPILVFCSTRKGVFSSAEQLMKEYRENEKNKKELPWTRPTRINHLFNDKRLDDLALFGIGVHHAGLTMDDRRAIEELYIQKKLRILVATSTLAVGVNLPAHMVVIKGVHTFQKNTSMEYSDLDIMQMLGRAGRPQFDKDGIAIILCETTLEHKYKSLVQGNTVLESSLHLNLSEHLNSEIGLGTITSIESAKDWLRGSFLFQRIQQNPNHYSLGKEETQSWQDRVDDVVLQNITKLKDSDLIRLDDENGKMLSTDYGDVMNKFYIRQSTMTLILNLPENPTLREILEVIAGAEELCDTKMRASEKTIYNRLRKHPDMRFEVKKVETTADKVFVLVQAVLGGISLNAAEYRSADSQPHLEAYSVFRHITRVARAVVEVAVIKKHGAQLKHGLELVRSLTARAWEDRPVVLRQIEQIGEKSLKVLTEHNINSINALRNQNPDNIELLLNRHPPFGLEILSFLSELPNYSLQITEIDVKSTGGREFVEANLSIECGLLQEIKRTSKLKKTKTRSFDMTSILTLTSDLVFIDFRRIPTKALKTTKSFEITAKLSKPSQSVIVLVSSESIAGVMVQQHYKPLVASYEYPIMNTRPLSSLEMDISGLEDDPDFWNMDIEDGPEVIPIRDLTTPRKQSASRVLSVNDSSKAPIRKFSNGKHECNHPCKDKTTCRHLCCREGLPGSSKRKPTLHSQPSMISQTVTKVAKIKSDREMKQLETIHKQTSVSHNLQLSAGKRIKLESQEQRLKRKPNFNIDLTVLKDNSPSPFPTEPVFIHDEDDLPEAVACDRVDSLPCAPCAVEESSGLNYSDSGVDTLIRAFPTEVVTVGTEFTMAESDYVPLVGILSDTPFSHKRKHLSGDTTQTQKRSKPAMQVYSKNRVSHCFKVAQNEVLYLSSSEDAEVLRKDQTSINEFSFHKGISEGNELMMDYDFVKVLPDQVGTSLGEWISPSGFETNVPLFASQTSDVGKHDVILPPGDTDGSEDNEFADLDAWLVSGSVEIV